VTDTVQGEFKSEIQIRVDARIATITLNRPEVGNALTRAMMVALANQIRMLSARSDVHVVVLAANGNEFCRGRDAGPIGTENRGALSAYRLRENLMSGLLTVFEEISRAPIPLVACVQGPTNNFGVTLAAACDITLASENATFRYGEIEQGTPPTTAISILLPSVSTKALSYLIYSAREFSARKALSCGLVTDVFPHAEFGGETTSFIRTLAERPRVTLESIKRFHGKAAGLPPDMRAEFAVTVRALAATEGV
jgi:enoyl-CoA hydratase/carnithine racemase